jgi:hypothetical protein
MPMRQLIVFAGLVYLASATVGSGASPSNDGVGGPAVMRKLTQAQYRNTIRDIFGPVTLNGRFDPDPRSDQLIAVGAGKTTVTPTGFEGFDRIAGGISSQVISPRRRDEFVPCKPVSAKEADDACARDFIGTMGHLLFRRPMTQDEIATFSKLASDSANQTHDFYSGLELALTGILTSPQFLFVADRKEADPAHPGSYRLTPSAMASRLSFLLWNSTPDLTLLEAAERGDLNTPKGLAKQVDRMLDSPRLEFGVRAFFTDMLQFDAYGTLEKDAELYPAYNPKISGQSQEQTLRTIVSLLLDQNGDYRDLFTTRKTFMTSMLASAYNVPFDADFTSDGQWFPYEIPADQPAAGILTQFSFVGLHSHPGRSSPTLRGKALREILMCEKVPDPPGNVDFTQFNASYAKKMTVRQRLTLHQQNPVCAGCHRITDPIGLALENFDTVGAYRTAEDDVKIDASGALDGKAFTDVAGFGKAFHDSPEPSACLVQRIYSYGTGRKPTPGEDAWLRDYAKGDFAAGGYQLRKLLRYVATSPNFYRVIQQTGSDGTH